MEAEPKGESQPVRDNQECKCTVWLKKWKLLELKCLTMKVMEEFDIALMQEHWAWGELIDNNTSEVPRTCIRTHKGISILPLSNICSKNLMVVKLRMNWISISPVWHSSHHQSRRWEEPVRACRTYGNHIICDVCDHNS